MIGCFQRGEYWQWQQIFQMNQVNDVSFPFYNWVQQSNFNSNCVWLPVKIVITKQEELMLTANLEESVQHQM